MRNKRAIAAIANGRSSSRVRRMFEQAERGEDFLMDRSEERVRKRREGRGRSEKRGYAVAGLREMEVQDDDGTTAWMVGQGLKAEHARRSAMRYDAREVIMGERHPSDERAQNVPRHRRVPSSVPQEQENVYLGARKADTNIDHAFVPVTMPRTEARRDVWAPVKKKTTMAEAIKGQYSRALQQSPAERLREASMRPMRTGDQAAPRRFHRPPNALSLPQVDGAGVDLKPNGSTSGFYLTKKTDDPSRASGPTAEDDNDLTQPSTAALRRGEKVPDIAALEALDSSFTDWPGLPQAKIAEADPFRGTANPDFFKRAFKLGAGEASAMLGPSSGELLDRDTFATEDMNETDPPPSYSEAQTEPDRHLSPHLVPAPSLGIHGQSDLDSVMENVGYEAYARACSNILCYDHHAPNMRSLVQTLQDLTDKGTSEDLDLAELLYHSVFVPWKTDKRIPLSPPSCSVLALKLFEAGLDLRAAAILFPYDLQDLSGRLRDKSRETQTFMLYRNASRYLTWRFRDIRDSRTVRKELRRVLECAENMGIKPEDGPIDYLLLPVVRHLCQRRELKQAASVLRDTTKQLSLPIEDTLQSTEILLAALATEGDMITLRDMFDELHASGLSRNQPKWFSNLFANVLDRHLAHNTTSDSYDLLIHALAYWGLMPTSKVSINFIAACLKDARYDYIQEYVQALRQQYPFLRLGTEDRLTAWRFSVVWRDMAASCEDIQKGCQAIAYCATSNSFGDHLQAAATEATSSDLSRCVAAVSSLTCGKDGNSIIRELKRLDFGKLLQKAEEIVRQPGLSTKQYLDARHLLLKQIQAITKLNKLFSGEKLEGKVQMPRVRQSAMVKRRRLRDSSEIASKIFEKHNSLPIRETLFRLLATHYLQRQEDGLPVDHTLLKHVVREMIRLNNENDAAVLINAVHSSPYALHPTGEPFDEDMFHLWLDVVRRLDAPRVQRQVMWALIDEADNIVLTQQFVSATLLCCRNLRKQKGATKAVKFDSYLLDEMNYLADRVEKWLKRQQGSISDEQRVTWSEYWNFDERTTDVGLDDESKTWDRRARPADQPAYDHDVEHHREQLVKQVQAC